MEEVCGRGGGGGGGCGLRRLTDAGLLRPQCRGSMLVPMLSARLPELWRCCLFPTAASSAACVILHLVPVQSPPNGHTATARDCNWMPGGLTQMSCLRRGSASTQNA